MQKNEPCSRILRIKVDIDQKYRITISIKRNDEIDFHIWEKITSPIKKIEELSGNVLSELVENRKSCKNFR